MKILFVCRANVGRSQIAEAVFNKLMKKDLAISAGIEPHKWENKKIDEAEKLIKSMKEIGCDLKNKISKRITKEMVDSADKIVVIGVDKNTWPDYVTSSGH